MRVTWASGSSLSSLEMCRQLPTGWQYFLVIPLYWDTGLPSPRLAVLLWRQAWDSFLLRRCHPYKRLISSSIKIHRVKQAVARSYFWSPFLAQERFWRERPSTRRTTTRRVAIYTQLKHILTFKKQLVPVVEYCVADVKHQISVILCAICDIALYWSVGLSLYRIFTAAVWYSLLLYCRDTWAPTDICKNGYLSLLQKTKNMDKCV